MVAKFYSLEWKKSDVEFIVRNPGEKKPSGYCQEFKRNADGSIVYMIPQKNMYILTLQTEDGKLVSDDVYGVIKYYNPNIRITKSFRKRYENFMRTQEYEVESNGFIRGIYNSTEAFIQNNP